MFILSSWFFFDWFILKLMLLIILLLDILNKILISQEYLLRLSWCWWRLECQIIRFLNLLRFHILFFVYLLFRISPIIFIFSLVSTLNRRKPWLERIKILLKVLLDWCPNIISERNFLSFLYIVLFIFVIILLERSLLVEIWSFRDVIFGSIVCWSTLLITILRIAKSIWILVYIA
jgi:hypothetical protein